MNDYLQYERGKNHTADMSLEAAGSGHEVPATSRSVTHNHEFLSSANSNSVSDCVFTLSGAFFM